MYQVCPESKDTSCVGWWGNFLCLLWQHCCRPWSFTCEPCSLTLVEPALFEWDVFEMAAPIQSPAKYVVCSVLWFLNAEGERGIYWTIRRTLQNSHELTPSDFVLFLHLKEHLAGKKLDDDDEVQEEVVMWFKWQAADFCHSGIQ